MKKNFISILISISFIFISYSNAQEISSAPLDLSLEQSLPQMPGRIEGEGNYFEIINSEYLNIKLDSSEQIKLILESMTEMVTAMIKSSTSTIATSTQITLSGFNSNTKYYKYEDNYHNLTEFITDENGNYSYVQDLSQQHLVFIQPRKSTKFIKDDATGGDCYLIGNWDLTTKTCTLTKDLNETIQIDDNNIILDGYGHTLTGTGYGIYLYQKSNVVIKNFNVKNFFNGIRLTYYSKNNSLINNNLNSNQYGIFNDWHSDNNNIINNNINFNKGTGIYIYYSVGNTIENNIINSNQWGVTLITSNGNILKKNIILNSKDYNFWISGFDDSDFNNNIDTTNIINGKPIYYIKDVDGVIYNNTNASVFYCIRCNNVTIKNLILSQNINGLFLWKTTNSKIENIISFNNESGIKLEYSSNNIIINNNLNSNKLYGIFMHKYSNNNIIANNIISFNKGYGIYFYIRNSNNNIYNNNFINNSSDYVNAAYNSIFNLPLPIGGNYWSNYDTPIEGCNDIDFNNICDSPYDLWGAKDNYPWKIKDGWLILQQPNQFFSQIQNSQTLYLRKTAGIQNKPSDDIIKTLPNDWTVKVIKTTDDNGNNIDIDGYHWYQIEDKTDGAVGWMAAKNLSDNTVYLNYDANNQSELQSKAEVQLDTTDKRKPVILEAVNNYHIKDNSENSLYGGGGGRDNNKNNFQKFIIGSESPKELILAVAAEESGGHEFNNEVCSDAFDGGIGIMQITSSDSKGLGSGLNIDSKRNDCKGEEWVGRFSKYYSNTLQGIYANIKDGFRVLQEKYDQTLRLMANPQIITPCPLTIDGVNLTCSDIQKSLTVWGYNGIGKNKRGQYGDYLGDVAVKLRNLNNYFAGIINDVNRTEIETLSYKLETVNNNKTLVKLNSPGELQIIDSQGRGTGIFDNIIKEEIPFSLYDANIKGAAIFFQNESYLYKVIGTANGIYGLDIENAQHGNFSGFSSVHLPIAENEIHQYQIDWDALNKGEKGVKLNIDYEGDGVIDQIINSDAELHDIEPPQITANVSEEYLLNSQFQIQFSATDKVSGIASVEATLNGIAVNNGQNVILTKLGLNTLKIIATDNDGNISTLIKEFNVVYKFIGLFPPIKNNNGGTYKLNQTLPIKFQLTDVNDSYISTAIAQLSIEEKYIGAFRYDNIDNQYVYNLSTKSLIAGIQQLKIVLDDNKNYEVVISLK